MTRKDDPEDLPVERMRMQSVSKDWLIGVLVLIIGALCGVSVKNLDLKQSQLQGDLSTLSITVRDNGNRISRIEESRAEFFRRLNDIDTKLDTIIGWKYGKVN